MIDSTQGWINYPYSDIHSIRTSSDFTYTEIKNSAGNIILSPATLISLYLKFHCEKYNIEYSISSLEAKRVIIRGRTSSNPSVDSTISLSEDKKWINESAISLYNAPIQFVIKYKNVEIKNEKNESDFFHDFFIILTLHHNGHIGISGWRQNIAYNNFVNLYLHSHLSKIEFHRVYPLNYFCTGSYRTPINTTRRNLEEFTSMGSGSLRYLSNNIYYENNPEFLSYVENFETKLLKFISCLRPLVSSESISGGPYNYLRYNKISYGRKEISQNRINEIAELICNNTKDARLSFSVTSNNSVSIKEDAGLISFAKEHNFYYDIFAIKSLKGNEYHDSVSKDDELQLSSDEIKRTTKYSKMCLSPFYWNDKRLNMNVIYEQNTKINDNSVKIKDDYRTNINNRITEYFGRKLQLFML